jgi:hypothetical protein
LCRLRLRRLLLLGEMAARDKRPATGELRLAKARELGAQQAVAGDDG